MNSESDPAPTSSGRLSLTRSTTRSQLGMSMAALSCPGRPTLKDAANPDSQALSGALIRWNEGISDNVSLTEYYDPCVLSLNIPDKFQGVGLTIRLYQHLRMFRVGVITGLNVSSTTTIRFATAGEAATALRVICNPTFYSIVGAAITVGYMPKKTDEQLKAQIQDLQHLLEERVLQQETMAR
ncbi:uncharacterized protein EV420DRAFT_866759 [Desarmillaria tabescens]|uniref:Uncharacterized protein n=1 Tax=Armillaria tabescens TaxID=1929756 RepID=A0AA39MVP5_ARMTA|nr:uncharacterized protein EV420DRAFT_866759 [Desarmillaria tabescens]KAK0447933.1 hypothetical protein EV420DRAFT_866759 [Desarmillaria tabescens]